MVQNSLEATHFTTLVERREDPICKLVTGLYGSCLSIPVQLTPGVPTSPLRHWVQKSARADVGWPGALYLAADCWYAVDQHDADGEELGRHPVLARFGR